MRSSRDERPPNSRSGVGQAIGDAAAYPARVAAHALRGQIETAAEDVLAAPELARLLDRALAGSLPEDVARSLVRHRVPERIVQELAATGELDRLVDQMLASPRSVEFVDRVLASDEMQHALKRVLSGPELRGALAAQSAGLAEQVSEGLRRAARSLDRRIGPSSAAAPETFAGFASRAVGLVIDAALVAAGTLVLGVALGLVAWLAGDLHRNWLAGSLTAVATAVITAGYFTVFWSTVGQTPGMRVMGVRVQIDGADRHPAAGRALLRTFGLVLAIAICFLGFVPALFDRRHRALQDFMARTVVVYDGPHER